MATRMIKVGAGYIKEYNALRMLADNLEQIERLQGTNTMIWRGFADLAEEHADTVKGRVGPAENVGTQGDKQG